MNANAYKTLAIMLTISFFIMYAVMFFNVDELDHIYISTNRFYMALLMVSPMSLLMIGFMRDMYKDRKWNLIVVSISIIVFVAAFAGLRNQTFICDSQYMKGMISHHSSAILTSKNANIKDPEVRQLADSIIASQEREIRQMKEILKKMGR